MASRHLSENIADVAGIAAAYDGYQASLAGQAAPTEDWILWRSAVLHRFRTELGIKDTRSRAASAGTDRSARPAEYRADTVRNIDGWYASFDVKPGETLYLAPAERVRIW